jgi:hypothetical protein
MNILFLKQMLSSGMTGLASSKRGAMVWFILLFTAVIIVNLATGGRVKLDPTLQTQLFELVIICIGVVFGEPFLKVWREYRSKQQTPPTDSVK